MFYIKSFESGGMGKKKSKTRQQNKCILAKGLLKHSAISRSIAGAFINFPKRMCSNQEEQICLLCYSYTLVNNPYQWLTDRRETVKF